MKPVVSHYIILINVLFSVALRAVCDASYHFTFVDIVAYGKNLGTRIFQNSMLRNKISGNEYNILDHYSVTGESDNILPHVFVGCEAFVLSTHIMRPYSYKKKSIEKSTVCNFRQSRQGVLSNALLEFQVISVFHRSLNVSVDSAQNIGKAYVILHNFVRKRDGFRFEDTFIYKGLHKTLFSQKHLAQEKHL